MHNDKKRRILKSLLGAVGIAVFVVLATVQVRAHAGNYIMSVINKTLIYYLAVASLNLMLGFAGYLNFSTIAFMGVSAFFTADFALAGWPMLAAMLMATAISTAISFVLGFALLRLKGPYFVFGSMGLLYIAAVIFGNLVAYSGGPNGRSNYGKLVVFGHTISGFKQWFPILLVIAILTIWFVFRIKKTSLGRSLMAIRDDETAACTLGINAFRTKIIAFVIASTMCGFAGSLLAAHNGVVSASLFGMNIAQEFVIMAMLGGILNPIGSFVGAFIVSWLPEMLRFSTSWMNIIYGVMVVILMIFMPMGLSSIVTQSVKRIRRGLRAKRTNRTKEEKNNVMSEG